MNSSSIKKTTLVLLLTFFISACFAPPQEQSGITPFKVVATEITTTVKPEIQPVITATLSPTNTPNPNLIIANSPDNRYTIQLTLSDTPINLIILDNVSKQKTQIPISYKGYNKIEGDDSSGFKWSTDNKIVMFVLYSEPYPEKSTESFTCFFAINIEQAKLLTAKYSSVGLHLWTPDGTDIFILEHSGLNDVFDYYIPGTNCYKSTFYSECENSYVSPSGKWEFDLWGESNVTLRSLNGETWKYSYHVTDSESGFIHTLVQGWLDNENIVLFSPASGYGTSKIYGLFQMDSRNGDVISLLGNNTINLSPYYLSVSPSGTKTVYVTSKGKGFIKDLSKNTETSFKMSFRDDETIASFIWSPDETMVVFAKFKLDQKSEIVAANYFRLNVESSELITLLNDEPEYLNVFKITNSEVTIGQNSFSLIDGTVLR